MAFFTKLFYLLKMLITHNYLKLLLTICFCLIITACQKPPSDDQSTKQITTPPPSSQSKIKGCKECHQFAFDDNHKECTSCHQGDKGQSTKELAHHNLLATPGHPDIMSIKCGSCHTQITSQAKSSLHFTLKNEVNTVRQAFGAEENLQSLLKIPQNIRPTTKTELVDDLLRRRCLRCHLYYAGDAYPATTHGQGCAACHLEFINGKLESHVFNKYPNDQQCLSCHYGNFVGADYYGRFEHDYNWEYRTPFSKSTEVESPAYGVEFHQLTPDIHQKNGITCIDCHTGDQLMGSGTAIMCNSCHLHDNNNQLPPNLINENGSLFLTTKKDHKKIKIPQAVSSVHTVYANIAACTVCHAQWSFADRSTHLLRLDEANYDEWMALTRQGSLEVEYYLEADLFSETGESQAVMMDKLDGEIYPGIWLKSYSLRRWEDILICPDQSGKLQVCRNLLNIHLSYVNEDDELIFNEASPENKQKLTPYTPHTIGKAGPFFKLRLRGLDSDK